SGAEVLAVHALARGAQVPRPQVHAQRRQPDDDRQELRRRSQLAAVPGRPEGLSGTRAGRPDGSRTRRRQPAGWWDTVSVTPSAQTRVDGTLGYAGNYSVVNHRSGTITALPAVGRVVKQGQPFYKIDGSPVILLYGSTPAYRDLRQGESGADVRQLNADLVA